MVLEGDRWFGIPVHSFAKDLRPIGRTYDWTHEQISLRPILLQCEADQTSVDFTQSRYLTTISKPSTDLLRKPQLLSTQIYCDAQPLSMFLALDFLSVDLKFKSLERGAQSIFSEFQAKQPTKNIGARWLSIAAAFSDGKWLTRTRGLANGQPTRFQPSDFERMQIYSRNK